MTIASIVEELDGEILRLKQVRELLSNGSHFDSAKLTAASRKGNSKSPRTKKRVLSAQARQKIAEAQRKRWAAQKQASK
jgi:hypothetical protein